MPFIGRLAIIALMCIGNNKVCTLNFSKKDKTKQWKNETKCSFTRKSLHLENVDSYSHEIKRQTNS